MKKLLRYLNDVKNIGIYIALIGTILSVIYSFVIFPEISDMHRLNLDPDKYERLARGLNNYRTFSYYPDTQPTMDRGPVYPLFIAALLKLTGNWWPYSVQAAQCILFGITCLIVFSLSNTIFNRKVGIISAFICALHPYLIQFTSRILIENLAAFIFTAMNAALLYFTLQPGKIRSIILGVIIGAGALCKATFLPFVLIIPVMLRLIRNSKINWQHTVIVFISALAVILPWTTRNYNLSGKIIPVHILSGFNIRWGDYFVDNFAAASFSIAELRQAGKYEVYAPLNEWKKENPEKWNTMQNWERGITVDSLFLTKSLKRYKENPLFLLKKIAVNSTLYWTLGFSTTKSIIISLLQLPLLALFILSALKLLYKGEVRSLPGMHISIVMFYFLFHLPVFSFARLSVVLIPVMIVYAAGAFGTLTDNRISS